MENNKKLGIIFIIISLIVGGMFVYFSNNLANQSNERGCYASVDCVPIEKGLSVSHIAIGIFSFMLALGFYLLVFSRERIIKQKDYDLTKLNKEEKEVFYYIKENKDEGVYQSNLVEKFNIPKSKVSRILDKLERLEIVERKRRGMTNIILLK